MELFYTIKNDILDEFKGARKSCELKLISFLQSISPIESKMTSKRHTWFLLFTRLALLFSKYSSACAKLRKILNHTSLSSVAFAKSLTMALIWHASGKRKMTLQ